MLENLSSPEFSLEGFFISISIVLKGFMNTNVLILEGLILKDWDFTQPLVFTDTVLVVLLKEGNSSFV